AGDRLGRGGHAAASGRGHSRRARDRRPGGLDLSFRRALRAGGQDLHGGRRLADAAGSLSASEAKPARWPENALILAACGARGYEGREWTNSPSTISSDA